MKGALRFLCVALHLWLVVSGDGDSTEAKGDTTQKDTALGESSSVQPSTLTSGNGLERIDDDISAVSSESKEVSSEGAQQRQGALSEDGDSQQQVADPPPRFGQRVRSETRRPDVGLRPRLTPGDLQKPSRFRGRAPALTADSSERSADQEPRRPDENPIQDSRPYAGRPNPLLRPAFNGGPSQQRPNNPLFRTSFAGPLNNPPGFPGGNYPFQPVRSALPPPQSSQQALFNGAARPASGGPPTNGQVLFNPPPQSISNGPFAFPPRNVFDAFGDPRLRAQFPISNEILFSSFPAPNPLRLASATSPGFQLFPQAQVQSQPFLVQPSRQQQQQQSFFGLPDSSLQLMNFGGTDDFPVPDFSAFGNNPYATGSDEAFGGDFGGPFVPSYGPSSGGDVIRVSSEEDQQQASDTSQEDAARASKEPNSAAPNDRDPVSTNSGDPSNNARVPFFGGVPDVFMRYPVNEAGYAVEERTNLPSGPNGTGAERPAADVMRDIFARDPYRDALNGSSGTFQAPEILFRDAAIDFGYRRRPFEYPSDARGRGSVGGGQFLRPLAPLAYPFLGGRQDGMREPDAEPPCAKSSNASFCFEDEKYPWNDVLYSLNTNTFLMDRMSGSELEVNATAFLESGSEGRFACDAEVRTGRLLRARSLAGAWRVVVNAQRFAQVVRMEVCRSGGDPCSNIVESGPKTSCVQKYSVQRLLAWSPDRGVFTDLFRIPVACSCQIL